MKQRPDFGAGAETFFGSLEGPIADLAREVRGIVLEALPDVRESLKWGMPVYERDGLICAIRPGNGYVALQFYAAGTSLRDPGGLLEGTGKRMRHVKIRGKGDIRKRLFTSWLRQAAAVGAR